MRTSPWCQSCSILLLLGLGRLSQRQHPNRRRGPYPESHPTSRTLATITTTKPAYATEPKSILLQPVGVKPTALMKKAFKKWFASIEGSVSSMTLCSRTCASTEVPPRVSKIRLINVVLLRALSEIKLKRTDTTLDLSQKAKRAGEEKKKKAKTEARRRCLI